MNQIHNGIKSFWARLKFNLYFSFVCWNIGLISKAATTTFSNRLRIKGAFLFVRNVIQREISHFCCAEEFFLNWMQIGNYRKHTSKNALSAWLLNMSKKRITAKIAFCVQCSEYTATNTKLNFIRFSPRYYSIIRNPKL